MGRGGGSGASRDVSRSVEVSPREIEAIGLSVILSCYP